MDRRCRDHDPEGAGATLIVVTEAQLSRTVWLIFSR